MKKKLPVLFLLVILCLAMTACGKKRELKEYTVLSTDRENEYDFIYDELKHRIVVCEPEQTDGDTAVLLMLHGYGGNASAFKRETGMDEQATLRNYIVVYVTGVSDKNDPTSAGGWNSDIASENGEYVKDDVGMLAALVSYIQEEYKLDSDKAFVAGFSNGGFMMFRLAVEAQDVFSACASVAGKVPEGTWNVYKDKNKVTAGFLQINGTSDDVVPMRLNDSYKRAKDPAIEEVIEYLADVNKCSRIETVALSDKSSLIKYSGKKSKQIWEVIIDNGRHSWPDENFSGFNTNELILEYFDMYR